jgi:hypothetical protein
MFFILYYRNVTVDRVWFMDLALKNICTISLLKATYHFLARRQTDCYVSYSKLAVQIPPFILTVPNWLTINFHTPSSIHSAVKFKYLHSIGYHTYRYPLSFLEFSSIYWSSPFCLSHSFSFCVIYPTLYPSTNCYTNYYTLYICAFHFGFVLIIIYVYNVSI